MDKLSLYAQAFAYPAPDRLAACLAALKELPESPGRLEYAAFVHAIQPLSLGEWEELHTRTLDLNPEFAPYVGYQMWGDSYKRGDLMSQLNRAMQADQIDLGGELPDHLMPVLRYLDHSKEALPTLQEIFEPALKKMIHKLKHQDEANPYLHLLQAVLLTYTG